MFFDTFWWSKPAGTYNIDNSLRFRGSQWISAPTSGTNSAAEFFISLWLKRGKMNGEQQVIFSRTHGGTQSNFRFNTSEQLLGTEGGNNTNTTERYRDPSAWYHICAFREDNGSAAGTLWINGVLVRNNFRYPTSGWPMIIGRRATENDYYFDGYMAEVYGFFDFGSNIPQTLSCNDFGEFDVDGVWVPKRYAGTYGANDFYYDFSDPTDIGADRSGNGNDATPNGFSLTDSSDVTYDHMSDTPTNNYSVYNAAIHPRNSNIKRPYNANMTMGLNTASGSWVNGNAIQSFFKLPTSGKYILGDTSSGNTSSRERIFGTWIAPVTTNFGNDNLTRPEVGISSLIRFGNSYLHYRTEDTNFEQVAMTNQPGDGESKGMTFIAYDADTGHVWTGFSYPEGHASYTGNIIWDSGNPATGNNPTYTVTGQQYARCWYSRNGPGGGVNVGVDTWILNNNSIYQSNIINTPAGFQFLNTESLPTAPVPDGREHFRAVLDTGANILGSAQAVFPNALWWIKRRDGNNQHQLVDIVRNTETSSDVAVRTPDNSNESAYVASGGNSMVAWCWRAGDTIDTNNDGTIQTSVSVNQEAGFSIITYTGNQNSGATIGHGLSQTPEFFMVKIRDGGSTNSWAVYHQAMGATRFMKLDKTDKQITETNRWNDTAPTNQVISLGNDNSVNNNSNGFVCYAWHSVPGYSAFGQYSGNSNNDGPFIPLDFKPAFVMVKLWTGSSGSGPWSIWDSGRSPANENNLDLQPSSNSNEVTNQGKVDLLANGFKLRSTNRNGGGNSYIYVAFAENPFGGSNVRPATAR